MRENILWVEIIVLQGLYHQNPFWGRRDLSIFQTVFFGDFDKYLDFSAFILKSKYFYYIIFNCYSTLHLSLYRKFAEPVEVANRSIIGMYFKDCFSASKKQWSYSILNWYSTLHLSLYRRLAEPVEVANSSIIGMF